MKQRHFVAACILPVIYLAHGEEEASLIQVRNEGRDSTALASGARHIMVSGGTPNSRIYLSATRTGGNVDLWTTDDQSGRQLWLLSPCHGCAKNEVNIVISGGISWGGFGFFVSDKRYLSTNDEGHNVDLWKEDDRSGRQRWIITPAGNDGDYHIKVSGGVHKGWFDKTTRTYLSVTSDGRSVDLHYEDDGSGRQRWRFPGIAYHVLVSGGISPWGLGIFTSSRAYMSVWEKSHLLGLTERYYADLHYEDDDSGRQLWYFDKLPAANQNAAGNLYNIRVFGGIDGGLYGLVKPATYLSVNRVGSQVDLWPEDDGSGRQRWEITDAGNNEFHIKVSGGVLDWFIFHNKFLSTTSDGHKLDLYDHDDGSGRQRWRIEGADGTQFALNAGVDSNSDGGDGGHGDGGGGKGKEKAPSKWNSCEERDCRPFCTNHKHGPKPWKGKKCNWNCCAACDPCK